VKNKVFFGSLFFLLLSFLSPEKNDRFKDKDSGNKKTKTKLLRGL